ncbi:MAG: hypothetical protein LBH80_07055, partial [Prevotellaceae bacterium]|nr:hypothetical protein [Prevotellaceae bacterium]
MNDHVVRLYKQLRRRKPDFTMDLASFSSAIENEENRKRLHGHLVEEFGNNGFAMPYDSFSSTIGFPTRGQDVGAPSSVSVPSSDANAYPSPVPSAVKTDDVIRTFGPSLKQGAKAVYYGVQNFAGEIANRFSGSERDATRAMEILDRLESADRLDDYHPRRALNEDKMSDYAAAQERYKADLARWNEDNTVLNRLKDIVTGRSPKPPKNPFDMAPSIGDISNLFPDAEIRPYKLVEKALKKGDIAEARAFLKAAQQEETWGDRVSKAAMMELAKMKPTEGFGAFVGGMIPQMTGNVLAIAAAVHPATRPLARPLGRVNMGVLTASAAGQAMADARRYAEETGVAVSEDDVLRAGATVGFIEAITEEIPFLRYMKGVGGTAARRAGKKVTEEILSSPAARSELGSFFERAAKDIPGLKRFTKEGVKEFGLDVAAESLSEFAAEVGGTMVPMLYANREDYPTLSEIVLSGVEGAKGGAFMGAILGGGSGLVNNYAQNRR